MGGLAQEKIGKSKKIMEKLVLSLMGGLASARTDTRVLEFSIFQGANSLRGSEFYSASKCQIILSLEGY